MPTPVKYYNPAIRDAYKEVEGIAKEELLKGLPQAMQSVYAPILALADEEAVEYLKLDPKVYEVEEFMIRF